MPDAPTKTGLRVTGLVPNVVFYDDQNKPYYRKINATVENPTLVQPEIAQTTTLSSQVKDSKADTTVNLAVKQMAQAESDYRQGVSDYKTLNKLIDDANTSGDANAFSKALDYAESNKASLSNVLESKDISSLTRNLKETAQTIRETNFATKLINDEIEAGHLTQARVYAEKYQGTLEKASGKPETTRFINELRQAESDTKTTGIALDRISKAIDANNYTEARKIAESNRKVLEKTVGVTETEEYLNQIRSAERQSKVPGSMPSETPSEYGTEDLTVTRPIREITEPVSGFLREIAGTDEEVRTEIKKIAGEGGVGTTLEKVAMVGKGAYETIIPGTVEFVGQVPTAAEYVVRHPETTIPAALYVGKQIVDNVKQEATENPEKFAGSILGMVLLGKAASKLKIPESVKTTPGKVVSKIKKVSEEYGVSDILSKVPETVKGSAKSLKKSVTPKLTVSEFEPPNVFRDTSDVAIREAKRARESAVRTFRGREAESARLAKGIEETGLAKEYVTENLQNYLDNYKKNIVAEVKSGGLNENHPQVIKQIDAAVKVEQTRINKIPVIEARDIIEEGTGIKARRYISKEFESPNVFRDTSDVAIREAKRARESAVRTFRGREAESARLAKGIEETGLAKEYVTENLQKYLELFKQDVITGLESKGKNVDLPSIRRQIEADVQIEKTRLTKSKMPVTKARDIIEKKIGTKARRTLDKEFESPNVFRDTSDVAIREAKRARESEYKISRKKEAESARLAKQIEEPALAKEYVTENLQKYLDLFRKGLEKTIRDTGGDPASSKYARQIGAAVYQEKTRLTKSKMPVTKARDIIEKKIGTKARRTLDKEFESPNVFRDTSNKAIKEAKQAKEAIRKQFQLKELESEYLNKVRQDAVNKIKELGGDPTTPENVKMLNAVVNVEQNRLKKFDPLTRSKIIRGEDISVEFGITEIKQRPTISKPKVSKDLTKKLKKKWETRAKESVSEKGKPTGKSGQIAVQKQEQKLKSKEPVKTKVVQKQEQKSTTVSPVPLKQKLYNVRDYDSFGMEYEVVRRPAEPKSAYAVLGLRAKIKPSQKEPTGFEPVQEVRPKPVITARIPRKEKLAEFGVSGVSPIQKPETRQIRKTGFEPAEISVSKQGIKQVPAQVTKPTQKVKPKQTVKPKQISVPKPKPKIKTRQTVKPKTPAVQKPKTVVPFAWGEKKPIKKMKKRKGSKKTIEFAPVEMPFDNNTGTKYKKQKKQKNQKKGEEYGI